MCCMRCAAERWNIIHDMQWSRGIYMTIFLHELEIAVEDVNSVDVMNLKAYISLTQLIRQHITL